MRPLWGNGLRVKEVDCYGAFLSNLQGQSPRCSFSGKPQEPRSRIRPQLSATPMYSTQHDAKLLTSCGSGQRVALRAFPLMRLSEHAAKWRFMEGSLFSFLQTRI